MSRWGKLGKTCTIYLHEGGTKPVGPSAGTRYGAFVLNVTSVAFMLGGVGNGATIDLPPASTVPNITALNVYSEDACRYAEDVAIYDKSATVSYSQKIMALWNWNSNTVHAIKVDSDSSKSK